jgi:hypothetical protein
LTLDHSAAVDHGGIGEINQQQGALLGYQSISEVAVTPTQTMPKQVAADRSGGQHFVVVVEVVFAPYPSHDAPLSVGVTYPRSSSHTHWPLRLTITSAGTWDERTDHPLSKALMGCSVIQP